MTTIPELSTLIPDFLINVGAPNVRRDFSNDSIKCLLKINPVIFYEKI